MTTAVAKYRNARMSAQKCRLVADVVRGMRIEKALDELTFSTKKASEIVKKTLLSAVANAENNHGADIDELFVSEIYVDEGPTHKRWRARARGRVNQILKRTCHITVKVAEAQSEE